MAPPTAESNTTATDINPNTTTTTTVLHAPPTNATINQAHILSTPQTYTITCADPNLKDLVVHSLSTTNPASQVYNLTTAPFLTSWSARRTLKSSPSHTPLLDIRHHNSKLSEWEIQSPHGTRLCLVKDGEIPGKKITDATATVATEESYATVSLRSTDHAGTTTVFEVEGVAVAEMVLTASNDVGFLKGRGLVRSAWRLRVAEGCDAALVVALAVVRVEINHLWRR